LRWKFPGGEKGFQRRVAPFESAGDSIGTTRRNEQVGEERNMKDTTVLLVDDEVPFVESMTKKLTQRGISVVTAFSGEEALNHLRDLKNTDVVVLECENAGWTASRP